MKNDTDIFHAAMLHYGGRDGSHTPRSSAFKNIAKQMIDGQRQFMPQMPEVYFDFVLNPHVNANAFLSGGRYFISVFSGTVYILHTIFSRMLSDRRILPKIGDIQLELEEHQSLVGLTLDAEENHIIKMRPTRPRCFVRAEYNDRLLESAFRFLISHELAHIADGHVDYMAKQHNTSFIAELGWVGENEADMLTRQSLEVIADSQAAGILIDNVLSGLANQNYPVSLEEGVFRSVFSFCTCFRLFGDTTFTGTEETKAYPSVRVRQMLCLIQVQEVIQSWDIGVRQSCLTAVYNAVNAVEQAFSLLTETPPAVDGLLEAVGKIGIDYGERLIQHRNLVTMPALRPFSYHDFNEGNINIQRARNDTSIN